MRDLTVSLIQSDLYWEQPEANRAMFEEQIWNIEQTNLIILPEMFTTGFSMNAEPLAEPPGGTTFKWMRLLAKQKNAAVTGSCIVKEAGKFYNRLYFVFPDGSSEQYDKKHLFPLAGEDVPYTAGTKKLIVNYLGWNICPLICYDLRFPVWARSKKAGDQLYEFDLLIYAANWPDARINAWDTLLKARAIENLSFCAGVNRTGVDALKRNHIGHSAMYNYIGETMCFSESNEVLTTTISYSDLSSFREKYPFQLDADTFEM